MSNLYRLTEAVCFEPRRAWSVQARSAFVYSEGGSFTAQAGCLVMYLSARRFSDGQAARQEHVYRLSDGRIGVLETAPDGRFVLVEEPQMVALARQVRSLSEMVAEKGLHLDAVSRLDPFTLIRCPMCCSLDFLTLDLASVWCGNCNARFQTRSTAGDPGVVVDAYLEYYHPVRARYIVPRSLILTMVLKDFGHSSHPPGVCGDTCVNGDRPAAATPQGNKRPIPAGLRPGVRPCGLEVYDWSLYGTPELDNRDRRRELLRTREDGGEEAVDVRDGVYDLRSVHSDRLPSLHLLADGDIEKREWWYLVDGLPHTSEGNRGWHPIWWKVQAVTEGSSHGGLCVKSWRVVDGALCPSCLQPAQDGCHEYCDWEKLGWEPQ